MGRLGMAAAVLAVLAASAAATGAPRKGDDTAVNLARSAEVLAKDGDLDGAIRLFQKAYDLEPSPVLLYNVARLYDRKDDRKKAREWYGRYLAVEQDPEGIKRGRSRLEELLDRIPGVLRLVSEPGATLRVDGKEVGPTGVPVELKRGGHDVEVLLDGHVPARQRVDIGAGEETRVDVRLTPLPGRIVLSCDRAGATVEVDGRAAGTCPVAAPLEAAPGMHVVSVNAAGFEPFVSSVTLVAGQDRPVEVRWVPLPAAAKAPAPEPAVAAKAPEPAPASAAPVETVGAGPAGGSGVSPWQWVAIGVGGGIVLAGGACSLVAWMDRRAVQNATTTGTLVTGISRADAIRKEKQANDLTKASWALYAVGGAALVTGIVLAVLPDGKRPPAGAPAAGLSPVPGGAMALVSGSF